MSDKPDNQSPERNQNSGSDPEHSDDLENFSIWPPESPTGPATSSEHEKPWSKRVAKIDDALGEIRRINGEVPPESSPPPANPPPEIVDEIALPDLELSNLDHEMEDLKNGIAGDIDQDLDDEIAEAIRDQTDAEPPLELEEADVLPEQPLAVEEPFSLEPPVVSSPPPAGEPESTRLHTVAASGVAAAAQPRPSAPPRRKEVDQMVAGAVDSAPPSTTTSVTPPADAGRRVREKAEGELGQLWGNVFFSSEQPPPRAIIVTAARRRDGATQIATSLAIVGAEAGREHRIALIDFNLRNPGVAAALGLSDSPGLTDVLEGRVPLDEALRSLRLRNGSLLHVLTAGPLVDHPLGMLRSRQVQGLVAQLRDRFDHTIIDVTAANAHPDPQVVGAMVDGALLVACAGATPRETVAEARKRLDHVGVRCLGVVLNQRTHPIPGFVYRAT